MDLIAAPDMPITGVSDSSCVPPVAILILAVLYQRFLKKIAATRALYVKLAKLLDMYAKGTESEE